MSKTYKDTRRIIGRAPVSQDQKAGAFENKRAKAERRMRKVEMKELTRKYGVR